MLPCSGLVEVFGGGCFRTPSIMTAAVEKERRVTSDKASCSTCYASMYNISSISWYLDACPVYDLEALRCAVQRNYVRQRCVAQASWSTSAGLGEEVKTNDFIFKSLVFSQGITTSTKAPQAYGTAFMVLHARIVELCAPGKCPRRWLASSAQSRSRPAFLTVYYAFVDLSSRLRLKD